MPAHVRLQLLDAGPLADGGLQTVSPSPSLISLFFQKGLLQSKRFKCERSPAFPCMDCTCGFESNSLAAFSPEGFLLCFFFFLQVSLFDVSLLSP